MQALRTAQVQRKTHETDINLRLALDGQGTLEGSSGVGFFDHLLTAFCRFAAADLTLTCAGDLHVDAHHTVEDLGLCLGGALRQALGDKRGIRRLAHAFVPMDEALAFAALDICGRPMFCLETPLPQVQIGAFDAQLAEEFLRALCNEAGLCLHARVTGRNAHHMLEALFKALGRALDDAKAIDPRRADAVPSTKGVL
jgi:imidazoleglycerol-phosphate dehydratase